MKFKLHQKVLYVGCSFKIGAVSDTEIALKSSNKNVDDKVILKKHWHYIKLYGSDKHKSKRLDGSWIG